MLMVKGDLIQLAEEGKFDIIVHGCNCFNVMEAGIAKQIKEKFPKAYDADTKHSYAGDRNKLGHFSIMFESKFLIINAYTQFSFKTSKHDDVFEYDSFKTILNTFLHQFPLSNFGFPMIGMGLAGGDRTRIMEMLEDFSEKISKSGGSATLVEYDPLEKFVVRAIFPNEERSD